MDTTHQHGNESHHTVQCHQLPLFCKSKPLSAGFLFNILAYFEPLLESQPVETKSTSVTGVSLSLPRKD